MKTQVPHFASPATMREEIASSLRDSQWHEQEPYIMASEVKQSQTPDT
jgi:hypothetical protein